MRPLNIRTVFKADNTIWQKVMKLKGKSRKGEVKGIIYSVPCECGAIYIGHTGRNLHVRIKEHKWAVGNGDIKNGIPAHIMDTNHNIQREEAEVMAAEP